MEISIDNFVFLMLKELTGLKHFPDTIVYGCIKALRENHGYICNATDDEIYNSFKIAWQKTINLVG